MIIKTQDIRILDVTLVSFTASEGMLIGNKEQKGTKEIGPVTANILRIKHIK